MPKMKTRKTLKKRIKITKTGKILTKQSRTGHLKTKMTASRKTRKKQRIIQEDKGYRVMFKKMLGRAGAKLI